MENMMLWLLFFGSLSVSSTTATGSFQPEQVHIAVRDNNQDMMITWVTQNDTQSSVVEFGTKYLNMSVTGISTKFTDGGKEKREMWMHRVLLKDLQPDTRYLYHCGSNLGWSDMFTFLTWIEGNEWPVRAAMYGDLGAINAQSLTRLQQDVAHGLYDVIIHVGDFAYNMNYENARVGDEFMKQIEPIAAYVPYMTCPGNHEEAYNFSNYKARFSMPNYQLSESMFYSWNMGPAHFIAVNTEAYYYLNYGEAPLSNLWDWLINDLEQATKAEERAEHPWIILFGHRPMYCSNHGDSDCNNDANDKIRVGISGEYGMEELLYKYGVDVAVWAHKHCYERMFPVYNYTVMSGSTEAPYTNPKGPVHINTGSAGNRERQTKFDPVQPEWSAFRALDYGYTRFTIENMTHMYWEQVSVDKDGEIIDSMWLVKDEHGPYPELHPDNY